MSITKSEYQKIGDRKKDENGISDKRDNAGKRFHDRVKAARVQRVRVSKVAMAL